MTRILTGEEVRRLLPMDRCVELMADALESLHRGASLNPLRSFVWQPDRRGLIATMPGYLDTGGTEAGASGETEAGRLQRGAPAANAFGLKVISFFPGRREPGVESHLGFVALFDPGDGAPLAIVDAASITAIRTAAVSGLATRLLSRPDSAVVAILGSGVQARTHLEAMLAVRSPNEVRVWSPSPESCAEYRSWAGETLGIPVVVPQGPRETIAGADIVCTTTSSTVPVLFGEWLEPGMHVNAVGSSMRAARELDGAAMARSTLFVDRRESAVNESGDYLLALEEGAIGPEHIRAEIGEVVAGDHPGRTSEDEITLFDSLGLAIEDVAAAAWVLAEARREDVGVEVAFS
ncbi:MAG TPA: ornithine cyclodeaminase family protein [Thermoanaerobaculia bacterium]|nr:ornithine cyclodeaminase family protein [Thermoanaerobaculia bacterium]